jgi:hypothetical protein
MGCIILVLLAWTSNSEGDVRVTHRPGILEESIGQNRNLTWSIRPSHAQRETAELVRSVWLCAALRH